MSAAPVFERFEVNGYAMYPGTSSRPDLKITLQEGLTLVLGANGLGKTTLVTMLYRMCSGPSELRAASGAADFGGRGPEVIKLSARRRRLFADRVTDGAEDAAATLTMRLSSTVITITRRLADLSLVSLVENGVTRETNESTYQRSVASAAGVPTFGDWLLLLRYLVFYFEDRRALVWDPTAQRQLLRLLFFPMERASAWSEQEHKIQSLDSEMRNLQAVVTRQEVALAREESATKDAPSIREELQSLVRLQEVDEPRLAAANDELLALDADVQRARLAALTAEQDQESAFRNVEQLQLQVINAAFPSGAEVAKYIMAQLISDRRCLACDRESAEASEELRLRLETKHCVVCGTRLETDAPSPINKRSLTRAQRALDKASEHLASARRMLEEGEKARQSARNVVYELREAVAERRARMDHLLRQLPPEDTAMHERRAELASLRGHVEAMKRELGLRRTEFDQFITSITEEMASRADAVKEAFEGYAAGFLLEAVRLVWAPHKDTVGQSGRKVSYPAFELTLGSESFPSPVRRSDPQEVSESQREFIDLAFRMTLMTVGTTENVGSLVIDAPESSLDAVFVRRAARVLNRFAEPRRGNRLLITSNLIEGDLIPYLLRDAGITSGRDSRVVDLLSVAAPTAATKELHSEYTAVRRSLFQRASQAQRT